jgi:hypothetical protein
MFAGFAGSNANGFTHWHNKDFTVSNFAGIGRFGYGIHHLA